VFQPLTVALPDYPNYSPDSAETTAISPDGKTLLILTSGYNLNREGLPGQGRCVRNNAKTHGTQLRLH
jgi:hypothetical protein